LFCLFFIVAYPACKCHVPDQHSFHIRDGVELPCGEGAEGNAETPRSFMRWLFLGICCRNGEKKYRNQYKSNEKYGAVHLQTFQENPGRRNETGQRVSIVLS